MSDENVVVDPVLGRLLHTVPARYWGDTGPYAGQGKCPTCRGGGAMEVFEVAVRWGCGHTRSLPGRVASQVVVARKAA